MRHNITMPKARKVNGDARNTIISTFLKDPNRSAAKSFRKGLSSIPNKVFSSGNRDTVDCSKQIHQKIRSEVNVQLNSVENLHGNLQTLQRRLTKEDKSATQKLDLRFRKVFGFIQHFAVTDFEFKLVLFEEKHVRLFHDLAQREIFFLDATGRVVKKIKEFDKSFLYAMVMRHPFGKTVAIPALNYLTSSHSTESVRLSLMTLREKERKLFDECCQPKLIITDNSKVLKGAVLREFNGLIMSIVFLIYGNFLPSN